MAVHEIPLTPNAQRFQITLGGILYSLRFLWNEAEQCWVMDIGDQNNVPLANGIPLITGTDLLVQLGYLGIAGQMFVQSDNDTDEVPSYSSIGSLGHLYFVDQVV